MKIEKRGSGYRIRKTYKGKTYTVSVSNKPTKAEAVDLINKKIARSGYSAVYNMTFKEAVEAYCELKSNILSPSTIVGYKKSLRQLSDAFCGTKLNDIDQLKVQKEINDLSGSLAPKTVRNANGLIAAVIKTYRNGLRFDIKLPQKKKYEAVIPTTDEIKQILEHVKDTDYWVPFNLAILSLRRSEICALTPLDLEGNILTVNKAKIQNDQKKWIIKEYLKTEESVRSIYIPTEVADRIRSQGYIFTQHPERLLDHLHQAQKDLGIESFRFHDLRHYFASYAHTMGIPDKYIQQQGGWKTDHVMKNVYRHAMQEEITDMQKQYADKISAMLV